MAISTCIKCDNTTFEVAKLIPHGSNFPVWAVQCNRCGGVVGTHEYLAAQVFLKKQQAALDKIAQSLGVIINWESL